MKTELSKITQDLEQGKITEREAEILLLGLLGVRNSWLSPIDSERQWQENHIKKIWEGYPNICPNWQILNGLIRFSCEKLDIEVTEP
jgi:hypothetical protein